MVVQALSIVTIATGEDLSGEPIPKSQRFFDYIMMIAPGSLKKMVENNPLNKALSGFMQKMNGLTMRQIEMLAIKCGISDETIIKVYKKLAQEVYTDYPKSAKWLEDKLIGIPEGQIKGEIFKAIDSKSINDSTSVKTK